MPHRRSLAIAGLIHDLNNVFQTLVDAADLLSEDDRWQAVSAAILRSVERGKRITSSLQADHSASVSFRTILDNAIAFVEDLQLRGRGPEIRFECDVQDGIELPGNWAWERVLINLFLNALDAMPEGGTIQVEARRICEEMRREETRLVVRDTGSGIAPDILPRIFEPRVSTKASSGIGLHVVRTIVNQDGGRVEARNRVDGPGAEFAITVPVVRMRAARAV